jgi:hypothetical protein
MLKKFIIITNDWFDTLVEYKAMILMMSISICIIAICGITNNPWWFVGFAVLTAIWRFIGFRLRDNRYERKTYEKTRKSIN